DWSSDVCSSDLRLPDPPHTLHRARPDAADWPAWDRLQPPESASVVILFFAVTRLDGNDFSGCCINLHLDDSAGRLQELQFVKIHAVIMLELDLNGLAGIVTRDDVQDLTQRQDFPRKQRTARLFVITAMVGSAVIVARHATHGQGKQWCSHCKRRHDGHEPAPTCVAAGTVGTACFHEVASFVE